MRIREPKVTGLIFSTGKIVITGAKSERASMTAAKIFERTVQKVMGDEADNSDDSKVTLSNFKIQNIVASSDVGFSIKLESLQEEHKKFSRCHYEPELFPGLIYKLESPKVVLLIFTSGKIVLAGAKTRQEIYSAYQKIYPVLFNFKKKQRINLEHKDLHKALTK